MEQVVTPGFGVLHQCKWLLQKFGKKCEQVVLLGTLVVHGGPLGTVHAWGHISDVQGASDGCIVDRTEIRTIWLCHGDPPKKV